MGSDATACKSYTLLTVAAYGCAHAVEPVVVDIYENEKPLTRISFPDFSRIMVTMISREIVQFTDEQTVSSAEYY
jgi:hypothetical protein